MLFIPMQNSKLYFVHKLQKSFTFGTIFGSICQINFQAQLVCYERKNLIVNLLMFTLANSSLSKEVNLHFHDL